MNVHPTDLSVFPFWNTSKNLYSSSQSRWLPQLCFLSNRNSRSNSKEHGSSNVYSSVTTQCEKACLQATFTAAFPAPQLRLPVRASHSFVYLQHHQVKVNKAAASILTVRLNRQEKPTLPPAAHSNLNLDCFNYICHNTLQILQEKRANRFLIYCVFGKGLGIALVPVDLTSYYDHLLYCVTDLLVTSPPIHVHGRAMYMAKLETVTWRLGTN